MIRAPELQQGASQNTEIRGRDWMITHLTKAAISGTLVNVLLWWAALMPIDWLSQTAWLCVRGL